MADERKAGGSPTGGAKLAQAGKAAGQPSSVSPEGATAASAATLLRVGVALWCALFSFLVTNGVIYPAVAQVDPWIREWATGFSVVVCF